MAAFAAGTLVALVTGGTFGMIPALAFLDAPFFIGPVNGIVVSIAVFVVARRLIEVR